MFPAMLRPRQAGETGQPVRPLTGDQPVRGRGDDAGEADWIADVADDGDCAEPAVGVHHRSAHLKRLAVQTEDGAAARVKSAVVFEALDGDNRGGESGALGVESR